MTLPCASSQHIPSSIAKRTVASHSAHSKQCCVKIDSISLLDLADVPLATDMWNRIEENRANQLVLCSHLRDVSHLVADLHDSKVQLEQRSAQLNCRVSSLEADLADLRTKNHQLQHVNGAGGSGTSYIILSTIDLIERIPNPLRSAHAKLWISSTEEALKHFPTLDDQHTRMSTLAATAGTEQRASEAQRNSECLHAQLFIDLLVVAGDAASFAYPPLQLFCLPAAAASCLYVC